MDPLQWGRRKAYVTLQIKKTLYYLLRSSSEILRQLQNSCLMSVSAKMNVLKLIKVKASHLFKKSTCF